MTTTPPTTGTRGPESLVTSLELSKQLKEAGWQLEWSWMFREGYMLGDDGEPQDWLLTYGHQPEKKYVLPAPTAEEILRELPVAIASATNRLRVTKTSEGWEICYLDIPKLACSFCFSSSSLANAAARMWLYLKKNNLLPSTK